MIFEWEEKDIRGGRIVVKEDGMAAMIAFSLGKSRNERVMLVWLSNGCVFRVGAVNDILVILNTESFIPAEFVGIEQKGQEL